MAYQDPKQAIVAYLSEPSMLVSTAAPAQGNSWRGELRRGGHDAKPTTLHFLKERSLAHRQIYYVTFEDKTGRQFDFTCHVTEQSDGSWEMDGGAGGSARNQSQRGFPWANLGGGAWGQANAFYAGGYVEDNGKGVVHVELLSKNGVLLQDSVDDGIVLFLSDDIIEVPLQATLYNSQGQVVGTNTVFNIPPRVP